MTSQATNRREGVSMSCPAIVGNSEPEPELETARADQELLGALTIGGGNAWPGVGGGGSQRSQISLPSHLECTKTALNQLVSHTYCLKNR